MLGDSEKKIYVTIVEGRFAVSVPESDSKGSEFVTKEGKKKFYRYYKDLTGRIDSIIYVNPPAEHPTWSASWILNMHDADENYSVTMPVGSGYANSFFCILPNIDKQLAITLQPSMKDETYEGKTKTKRSIFVKQNGSWLKWFYSGADSGLPVIEKIVKKSGDVEYDDFERTEFFKELAAKFNKEETTKETIHHEPVPQVPDDDLPF